MGICRAAETLPRDTAHWTTSHARRKTVATPRTRRPEIAERLWALRQAIRSYKRPEHVRVSGRLGPACDRASRYRCALRRGRTPRPGLKTKREAVDLGL